MKTFLRDFLTTFVLAAIIFFLLNIVIVVPPSIVISGSMEPTLEIGQRLIIGKIAYTLHQPRRGDIITFHPPDNQHGDYIKRIIGLPGESVEIKNGIVYIHKENGNVLTLDEPYITNPARDSFRGGTIPKNGYFVLGDNRNNSGDSRQGWTVPRENIIGKAWLTIWPPGRWGLAPNCRLPE